MKSRNIVVCALVAASVAGHPSPCFADVVPGGGLVDATSTPVLLCGLAFVALVSGVSFVLLRRMSRRRVAAAATAAAMSPPVAAEEELTAMRDQLAAEQAAPSASSPDGHSDASDEG